MAVSRAHELAFLLGEPHPDWAWKGPARALTNAKIGRTLHILPPNSAGLPYFVVTDHVRTHNFDTAEEAKTWCMRRSWEISQIYGT